MNKLIILLFAVAISSCNVDSGNIKFEKYFVSGERIYEKKCSNCHQKDGSGFKGLYPSLNQNKLLSLGKEQVICLLKFGSNPTSTENSSRFNPVMPPSDLSSLEIAQLTTYIFSKWNNGENLMNVKEVNSILSKCKK